VVDKTGKIAPLVAALNQNLVQFGIFHRDLSIDESITPYFGCHSMKMFIRGKPIRFGFKWWCLCGTDGYPYALELYAGRETQSDGQQPLGTRVFNHMTDVVEKHSKTECHQLFFDNFFTSWALLTSLTDKNVAATGTVRENRTDGANNVLHSTKDMKKTGKRGDFDYCCDGMVFVLKWHDNSVVSVASNHFTHQLVQTANRRVKGSTSVPVTRPFMVRRYNKGMGGMDLMDRLLANYRPSICGKPLLTNILNVSVIAAWRPHCAVHGSGGMEHIDFRRDIMLCLLKAAQPQNTPVRKQPVAELPTDARRSVELDHQWVWCSQGRCRICCKNTRIMCCVWRSLAC